VLEGLRHLISGRPLDELLHDLADIFIVAYLAYRGLLVLRGTRAMQIGVGFVAFGLLYVIARYAELITLLNLLSWIASSIILIVVVVFQNDIRRALIRVGSKAWLTRSREQATRVVDEVVEAATELARHRIGAIIAFERDANLLEFVRGEGIHMDSLVSRELLVSLFLPESLNKTHDGAVLIRDLRITRAGMFFPMPESKVADPNFGSRHRAALGITEETDAVVVVVSEERGTITLCFQGSYVANIDSPSLRKILLEQLGHRSKRDKAQAEHGAARPAGRDDDERAATGPLTPRVPHSEASSTSSERTKPASGAPASTRQLTPAQGTPRVSPPSSAQPGKLPAPSADATGRSAAVSAQAAATTVASAAAASTTTASAITTGPATARRVSKPMATPTPPPLAALEVEPVEAGLTPLTSRVSRPMPTAKERKPVTDPHLELATMPSVEVDLSSELNEPFDGPDPPVGDEP
jgi:diadenylate cyclase